MPKKPAPAAEKASSAFEALKAKIETRQANVGIIGLGYVGLPLACAFAEAGYATTGFELDVAKVESIRQGHSYIPDVAEATTKDLVSKRLLNATNDFDVLSEQDAIIICVPT